MSRTEDLLARRARVVPAAVPKITDLVVDEADGAWLTLADGRRILDFATGIGVMGLGHSHPAVVEAIREQAGRLQHVCMHVATYEPYVAVCEALARLVPHGDETQVLLVNSGAEAVENAVKIARQATGRPGVLCFEGAFHGRTTMGMALTSKTATKAGCGPLVSEVYRLPYPGHRDDPSAALAALDDAFVSRVHPGSLAAVIVEVVQGEGGIMPCPGAWLRGLRERCTAHGILLIIDEVQAGLGRTGTWASWQHHGVKPDISTWAKAIGGGLPLGAVAAPRDVMERCAPGTLGTTFGGNPIACAASLAALAVMEAEDVCGRARRIGERIAAELGPLVDLPHVRDVRGLGAMWGVQLDSAEQIRRVLADCRDGGVLLIASGLRSDAFRLLPPLLLDDDDLTHALDVIGHAVRSVHG